jgi:hypothetical protein
MSTHYRIKCVCGKVLSQCRCPGPKKETLVDPCKCLCECDHIDFQRKISEALNSDAVCLKCGKTIRKKDVS